MNTEKTSGGNTVRHKKNGEEYILFIFFRILEKVCIAEQFFTILQKRSGDF